MGKRENHQSIWLVEECDHFIDERVMAALSKKEAGQDALLDAVKAEIREVRK